MKALSRPKKQNNDCIVFLPYGTGLSTEEPTNVNHCIGRVYHDYGIIRRVALLFCPHVYF